MAKYRCKVCKGKFDLLSDNRYTVYKQQSFFPPSKTEYDAFDCPYCGCQNIVNVRERNENEEVKTVKVKTYQERNEESDAWVLKDLGNGAWVKVCKKESIEDE